MKFACSNQDSPLNVRGFSTVIVRWGRLVRAMSREFEPSFRWVMCLVIPICGRVTWPPVGGVFYPPVESTADLRVTFVRATCRFKLFQRPCTWWGHYTRHKGQQIKLLEIGAKLPGCHNFVRILAAWLQEIDYDIIIKNRALVHQTQINMAGCLKIMVDDLCSVFISIEIILSPYSMGLQDNLLYNIFTRVGWI